jgi:hypothetical protein
MNLAHNPSDEEFQAIRDRLALRDAEKAERGLSLMSGWLNWSR